jgi:hypothetical protein
MFHVGQNGNGSLWREDLLGAVEESSLLSSVTGKRLLKSTLKTFNVCCSDLQIVEISDGAVTISHGSCVVVVNKSNLQSKPLSTVTHTSDNTYFTIYRADTEYNFMTKEEGKVYGTFEVTAHILHLLQRTVWLIMRFLNDSIPNKGLT